MQKLTICGPENRFAMQVPSRYQALQNSSIAADTVARPDQQGKLGGNSLSAFAQKPGSLAKQGGGSLGDGPRRVDSINFVAQHGGKQNPGVKSRVSSSGTVCQPAAPEFVTLPAQPQNQPLTTAWAAPAAAPASPVPGELIPATGSARKGGSTYSGLHKARLQHHAGLSPALGAEPSHNQGRDMSAATMLSFTTVYQDPADRRQATATAALPAGACGSQGSSKVQELVSLMTAAHAVPPVPRLNLHGLAPTPFTLAQQAAAVVKQKAATAELQQPPSASSMQEPQPPVQPHVPVGMQRASSGGISHPPAAGSPGLQGSKAASRLHTSISGSLGGPSVVLSTGNSLHSHTASGSSGGMKPLPQGSCRCEQHAVPVGRTCALSGICKHA
jgi:hypothetical protein